MDRHLTHKSLFWRKLDEPGHEACRLDFAGRYRHLTGAAVFLHERQVCLLEYQVICNAEWRTRSGRVTGWIGDRTIGISILVNDALHWQLNGAACPSLNGCIDLDLNFSPCTNLLPIRRLQLSVGEKETVRAAWLRFPEFTLEPLEQTYRRISTDLYRYESAGGFRAELRVTEEGFVSCYPGLWEREGTGTVVPVR